MRKILCGLKAAFYRGFPGVAEALRVRGKVAAALLPQQDVPKA